MTTTTTRRRLLGALAGGAAAAVGCGLVGKRFEVQVARETAEESLLAIGQAVPQVRPPTPQRITDEHVGAFARDVARLLRDPSPERRGAARMALVQVFGRAEVERRLGPASWDDLMAEALAAGVDVVEDAPLAGRVRAVQAHHTLSLQAGLGEADRRRLLADALDRPHAAAVFLDHDGGRWLMGERWAA